MTVTFRTFVGNTTCESTDPESGVRCSQPSGHHIAFDCSSGIRSWKYNPPPKEQGELYGEDEK